MKSLKCRDVGVDCDFEMKGSDEKEILSQAEKHGKEHHGIQEITDELKNKIRSKIQEVKAA